MEKPEEHLDKQTEPESTLPPAAENEPEDSLGDWIDRAKRAHELVDAVDLKKVAAHDPLEVSKLESVRTALKDLEEGKAIERVEGVDEVDPDVGEEQARVTKLFGDVAGAGWTDRMGRVLFVNGENSTAKPLELISHRQGLPDFDICIAPEHRYSDGNFGIFVSAQGVFAASINEPVSKHHWRIDRSRPYDNQTELVRSITQFSENDD